MMNLNRYVLLLLLGGMLFGVTACNQGGSGEGGDADGEGTSETANASGQDAPSETTQLKWESDAHDFGEIEGSEKVSHKYEFTNVGNHELVIDRVKPSCGCTAGDYTKDPVPPGGKGYVTLEFDPSGKNGVQNKTATVFANTEKPQKLSFTAVLPEKDG